MAQSYDQDGLSDFVLLADRNLVTQMRAHFWSFAGNVPAFALPLAFLPLRTNSFGTTESMILKNGARVADVRRCAVAASPPPRTFLRPKPRVVAGTFGGGRRRPFLCTRTRSRCGDGSAAVRQK